MKSQLVILLILVSSLLATDADQQWDNLLQQCNQFKNKCTPASTSLHSCCDLTNFRSKAPSGIYQIVSNGSCEASRYTKLSIDVYCDMDTTDGGWMVIQRNVKDGVNYFNRTWKEYEEGFGDLKSNKLWYGLKGLHLFTKTGQWELRIDFQFENGTRSFVHHSSFRIGDASEEYSLSIGGFTGVTFADPFMHWHQLNGQKFSTYDNINNVGNSKCAADYSGWWHRSCSHILPNHQPPYIYMGASYFLLSIEMRMRLLNCIIR